MATYSEAEDLINIGAYKKGSNKDIDYSIAKIGEVNGFLRQGVYEKFSFQEEEGALAAIFQQTDVVESET